MRINRLTSSALLVGLVLAVGACGDDDDNSDEAVSAAFCDNAEALAAAHPSFEGEPTPEQVAAFIGATVVPLAKTLEASAPDEIRDDIATVRSAEEEAAETNDLSLLDEVGDAQERVAAFVEGECGVTLG